MRPTSMLGTTAAPGHIAAVMLSIGSSTSGTRGDGGDGHRLRGRP